MLADRHVCLLSAWRVSFELFNRFPYSMSNTSNSISPALNTIALFDFVHFSWSSAEEGIVKDETNLISTAMPKGTILAIIMLFAFAVLEYTKQNIACTALNDDGVG